MERERSLAFLSVLDGRRYGIPWCPHLRILEKRGFPMPVYILVFEKANLKNWRFTYQEWNQTLCSRTNLRIYGLKNSGAFEGEKALGGFNLLNILPKETADEWKRMDFAKQNSKTNATVIVFADFVEFTQFFSQISSEGIGCRIGIIGFRNFDMDHTKYGWKK